jgi:hypothetical protein
VPAATEEPTLNVTLLPAVVVAVAGLNVAVTLLGSPLTAKLTLPLKPFRPLTLRVLAPLPPRGMVRLAGAAASVKLGTTTTRLTVVLLVRVPDVPVIVTG